MSQSVSLPSCCPNENRHDTYPAISPCPQCLGIVVAPTFAVKLPAMKPQASGSVHEIVDMHQELIFGCGSGHRSVFCGNETKRDSPSSMYSGLFSRRPIFVKGMTEGSEVRGSAYTEHARALRLTSHHQRIIPKLEVIDVVVYDMLKSTFRCSCIVGKKRQGCVAGHEGRHVPAYVASRA